jgi:hypothetical protein
VWWGRSLAKVSTLTFGVIAFVVLGIIIDASLGSRAERKRYHHFRKLEKRSKDAWLARSTDRISKDWDH